MLKGFKQGDSNVIKELLTGNHLVEADDKSGGTAENKGVDFSISGTKLPLQ